MLARTQVVDCQGLSKRPGIRGRGGSHCEDLPIRQRNLIFPNFSIVVTRLAAAGILHL